MGPRPDVARSMHGSALANEYPFTLTPSPASDFPRAFGDMDLAAAGIPDEQRYLADYCTHSGRDAIAEWRFFVVLALFRIAAILVGVHRRAVDGNAADARALEIGGSYPEIAERAREIARG